MTKKEIQDAGWHTESSEPEPQKQNPSTMERSFTELRFASFLGSIVNYPGRLSRVEMNALAGALDSLPRSDRHTVANVYPQKPHDFILGSGLKTVKSFSELGV
jgi:hypothetical protein